MGMVDTRLCPLLLHGMGLSGSLTSVDLLATWSSSAVSILALSWDCANLYRIFLETEFNLLSNEHP